MSVAVLAQLGRYRIVAELGRGAMGIVYRAEDPLLNRTVAIKTIIMSGDAAERADYEARFYQEAKAAGGLNHPNVITVHDIGREGEIAYMAMELLEGVDLRDLLKQGPVALPFALDVVAQVADGLAFAHARGVVHRDIKPGNIMIVRNRYAKIMDFGIARMRVSDVKTQTGSILGSPKYMSPEQAAGQRTGHHSDIFSLGVVLYELVVGRPPFSAPEIAQLLHQIAVVAHRPPSAVKGSLPAMLDLIVGKALEKRTETRYQSAAEMAADLRVCAAAVAGQYTPPRAGDAATAQLDADSATAAIDFGTATTRLNGADGTKTAVENEATVGAWIELDPTVNSAVVTRATDAGAYLPLSRRFDSSEAMVKLTELAAADRGRVGAQTTGLDSRSGDVPAASVAARVRTIFEHLQRDPPRQLFAVAVTLAIVIAMVIAIV